MAGYKYYTILTDVGKQKLVEAIANETALDFTEIAIGDANGVSYDPTGEETALKHIVFKKAIDSVSIDAVDKNIMIFEMVVPASSGGYYMREAGLFSSDGSLIAIARIAEQYKPLLSEGAGASITISMRIAVSSEAQVYINIPESINYATQNYVKEEFEKHITNSNPHEQYVLNETYSDKINELQENIAGKAASNHNHDSTYLKKTDASSTYATKSELSDGLAGKAASNHTHSNYAANSHSHDFSSITGSMDFADNRLKGLLPISKGGTNSLDGFGWKNAYLDAEFNAKIGLKYPFNTQQLASAIIKLNQPVFCMVYGWRKDENAITDFPGSDLTHRTIINMSDTNQFYLETIDPFNLTTYICNVSGGVAGNWIKTRNYDGSIPESLIPATQTHYTTSAGDWIETPLSDGKILLEGWGVGYNDTSDDVLITLPKTCVSIGNINSSVSIYGVVSGSCGYAGLGLTTEAFKGFCINSNNFGVSAGIGKKLLGYTWQFQGILA